MGHCRALFRFDFSTVYSKYLHFKTLPVIGFKPRIPGIGSNLCTNRATITAHAINYLVYCQTPKEFLLCFSGSG